MKVLIFGATGATGREVVKQALDCGHSVRAFVRNPDKFGIKHSDITLMVGDVTDQASVERAVQRPFIEPHILQIAFPMHLAAEALRKPFLPF